MRVTSLLLAAALTFSPALAGPIQESEARMASAYALYRRALFATNQTDAAAATQTVQSFGVAWRALASDWKRSPPPQYADDAKLAATIDDVSSSIEAASAEAARGALAPAHETLERIRDQLSELRMRNGVTNFSDDMNAYHEAMEHTLKRFAGAASIDMAALREDAALLDYLAKRIVARAPAAIRDATEFRGALAPFSGSVEALLRAARAGDADAVRKALNTLKKPYSMLFLGFG